MSEKKVVSPIQVFEAVKPACNALVPPPAVIVAVKTSRKAMSLEAAEGEEGEEGAEGAEGAEGEAAPAEAAAE